MNLRTNANLRTIDRLIAEKVMGWKLYNYTDSAYASNDAHYEDAARNDGWLWEGRGGDSEAWQWCPSTRPNDAQQVREKLAEKWDWILGNGKTRPNEPRFGFALYRKGKGNDEDAVFAAETDESEELAVCLCALRSAGINPESLT